MEREQIEEIGRAEKAAQSEGPGRLREEADRARAEADRLRGELASTQRALAASERALAEARSHRSTETARLQRQAYWLERWRVDLNTLMRRRPLMLTFRLLQGARRLKRAFAARRR